MPHEPSPATQRVGPLANVAALIERRGADPDILSARCGVDLRALSPEDRLPFHVVVDVLERAAELTQCPHFGLLLGTTASHATQGIIFRLACHAPTLRQALLDHVTWQPAYANGAILYLSRYADDYAVGYGIYDRQSLGSAQLYDAIMAMASTLLRDLTAGALNPLEVLMCRRPPEDPQVYRRIFRAPVRFNESQTCIVLPRAALDLPIPGANPAERATILAEITTQFSQVQPDIVTQVRRLTRPLLLDGMPSMVEAARELSMSTRTLRRHLAASDTTFEAIRDEVRFTLAKELLLLTDLPVGHVAEALAFATHAAFTNAYLRWSGDTPSAWRARMQPAPVRLAAGPDPGGTVAAEQ